MEQYRNYIGAVFQDYMIYAATVKENVLLGKADGTPDKDVRRSLEQSGFGE